MVIEDLIKSRLIDNYIMLFNMLEIKYDYNPDSYDELTIYGKNAIKIKDMITNIKDFELSIRSKPYRYVYRIECEVLIFAKLNKSPTIDYIDYYEGNYYIENID